MVNTILKIVLLVMLILAIATGGLVLFDWLGLLSLREQFAPVLRLVGLNTPTQAQATEELNDVRLRQQLESLELRRKDLEEQEKQQQQRTEELDEREREIERTEEQLQQQLRSLQEREDLYRNRNQKVAQIARNFSGMPPEQAVGQMNEMDSLLVVDVLRAAERIATEENTASLVSYWISLMPTARGAEINQLLVEKP